MATQEPTAPKKNNRKRRTWVLRVAVLLVVVGAVAGVILVRRSRGQRAEMQVVKTDKVTLGEVKETISATGKIAAETGASVKIGSQLSGRIKRLYADIGQHVDAGQVVAEIDVPEMAANLEAARRSAAQAETRYRQQVSTAPMTHADVSAVFEQASQQLLVSQGSRDQVRSSLVSVKTRLRSAQAAKVASDARLRDAQARLRSAQAGVPLQATQTSASLERSRASIATAQANLTQAQKAADLQVATAQAALNQAQANADLAEKTLNRQQALLDQGYVPQADVDSARTQRDVTAQQVASAGSSLKLTREQVAAALASAQSQVDSALADQQVAQAGKYQNTISAESVRSAEEGVEDAKGSVTQAVESVTSARADVVGSQAQLASAEASVRSARAGVRKALADMTQDRLKQQDIQAAYQSWQQSQAQVKNQEAQFAKSYIRTPFSGTVVTLNQQEGETVAAGLSAPVLIEVVDLNRLEVDANVDETDIGQVHVGQEATVTVDAYPDKEFKGRIVKVASSATTQDNVVTYLTTVKLDQAKGVFLRPQMTADVQIAIKVAKNAVLAPNEAVKQEEGNSLAVVMAGGKADVRQLKTGITDGEKTEVISGLKDGEEVVVAGFEKLGLEQFSSQAQLPRFLRQSSPFGMGTGTTTKAGAAGGAAKAGAAGGAAKAGAAGGAGKGGSGGGTGRGGSTRRSTSGGGPGGPPPPP